MTTLLLLVVFPLLYFDWLDIVLASAPSIAVVFQSYCSLRVVCLRIF